MSYPYHPLFRPSPYYVPRVPSMMADPNRLVPYSVFGQEPAPPAPTQAATEESVLGALKKVTPTLLIVGVATGAAFALGGMIAGRLFGSGRR